MDAIQQRLDEFLASLAGRQMVDDGNADDEVDGALAVGQAQGVCDDDLAVALGAGKMHEGIAAVGAEDVQAGVDGEVLAVAAADVEADCAGGLGGEERGDEGPGLVAGG